MPRPAPLPPSLDAFAFSVEAARDSGVSKARLRASDLNAPFHGVRTVGETAGDVVRTAQAYFSRAANDTIVSHFSAAKLWGMPLPARWSYDLRLHVSVPPDKRAPKGEGVVGHHVSLHPLDVVEINGLRLTTQVRTVCDLAGYLSPADLLAVVDYLNWYRRDEAHRIPVSELQKVIARHPTKRGMARLRGVVPLATDRSDSAPESIIRYRIIKAGFPPPAVNLELYDATGQFLAMPDLCWPKFRIAVDYEGDHHRTDPKQWDKDIHRVPRLQDAGWDHTRLARSDLANSHDFLARLARTLRSKGWQTP